MTRFDLAAIGAIGSLIELVSLGGVLLLYPRLSLDQATRDVEAATTMRVEILRMVTVNRSDLVAAQASLADLAQLMRNSEQEMYSRRLSRIEACVCP